MINVSNFLAQSVRILVNLRHLQLGLFAIAHDPSVNLANADSSNVIGNDTTERPASPQTEEEWNIDWEDYMMTVLNDPTLQVDLESFPLYLMFGKIPEEDSVLSIFGIPSKDSLEFSALILRARDCCPQPDAKV